MARIFLDSNFVIETIGLRHSEAVSESLKGHLAFVSPLTIHIVCYVFKRKIPDQVISDLVNQVHLTDFSQSLANLSLIGPTEDFEDNVQLHSASISAADYFLTHDQELLKMKFFGKTQITNKVN